MTFSNLKPMPIINIRGISYKTSQNVAMQSIPLFSAIGIDPNTLLTAAASISDAELYRRLGDPANWYKISYSLKSIIREIPDELVFCDCKNEVGFIDLSPKELEEVLKHIFQQALEEPVAQPVKPAEEKPVAKARRSRRAKAV